MASSLSFHIAVRHPPGNSTDDDSLHGIDALAAAATQPAPQLALGDPYATDTSFDLNQELSDSDNSSVLSMKSRNTLPSNHHLRQLAKQGAIIAGSRKTRRVLKWHIVV